MDKELLKRINKLNKEQLQAVNHIDNPCLVIAGAGSGKTEVLSVRLAKLIIEDGVNPENILVVTFTKEAKENMVKRLKPLVGEERAKKLYIGTFHSICLRILKETKTLKDGVTIMTSWKQEQIISKAMDNLKIYKINKEELLDWIGIQKTALRGWTSNFYEFYSTEEYPKLDEYIQLYREYENLKKRENLLDFGDMILKTYDLLENKKEIRTAYSLKFEQICIDEAQDSSEALFDIIKLLAEKHNNIFMVGDVRQSIYGFANAKVERLLTFEKEWTNSRVIYLTKNYRSTESIVELGNRLTNYNKHKFMQGNAVAHREIGVKPIFKACLDEYSEADFVANEIIKLRKRGVKYKDMAVLYRVNTQSISFELVFRKHNIPFVVFTNNEFFERKEIQLVIAYLQLALDNKNDMAFRQIYNTPYRGFNKDFLDRLNAYAYNRKISLLQALKTCPVVRESTKWINESRDLYKKIEQITKLTILYKYDVSRIVEEVLYSTNLYQYYKEKTDGEDNSIVDTLESFILLGEKFKSIDTFTKYCVKGIAEAKSSTNRGDKVKLMTCHKSKGMEFKITFCIGIAQGLMPYKKSLEDTYRYNEERRLCYVGITRAEDILYITYPMVYKSKDIALSDFMREMLDIDELKKVENEIYMDTTDLQDEKKVEKETIAEQMSLIF